MTTAAPGTATADLPGPSEPTRAFYFRNREGLRLYGESFVPAQPRAAALVVHGYAEHGGRYRELANILGQRGIATQTFDLRGHGRSDGQRGYVDRFSDYLDDLDAALAELEEQIPADVPIAIIGHSNGGLVSLRSLADPWRRPKRVRAVVLSSPFLGLKLRVSGVKTVTARLASLALPALSLPNDLVVEHLTRDPIKQRERQLDTLCHDVASARWYTEMEDAQQWVQEFAHRLSIPSLWLVAGADKIADPAAARAVHGRLRSESEYHELADDEHEVFNEIDRGAAYDLVLDFFQRHFSL